MDKMAGTHPLCLLPTVHVTHYVVKDSVEEKIIKMQEAKRALASKVLSATDGNTNALSSNLNKLSIAELQYLFRSAA